MNDNREPGKTIQRYNANERTNHWLVAILFFMAGLSGLALFHPAMFWLTNLFGGGPWTRILHPFMGVAMFLLFMGLVIRFWRANLFIANDRLWLKRVDRVIKNEEEGVPPIGKYNPGQKLLFWTLLLCMLGLLFSGLVIWRAYFSEYFGITVIRLGALLHALAGFVLIVSIIVHIYAGIWIKGSVGAMLHGWVSRAWARKHHELWYRKIVQHDDPKTRVTKKDDVLSQILEPGEIEAAAGTPPFLYLPPANLFALRAARLETLAEGHPLEDYLRLIAGLCRVQQSLLEHPPGDWMPDSQRLDACRQHGLPPLAADSLVREVHWQVYLDALLERYQSPAQPEVRQALAYLRDASEGQRKAWAIALLSGQYSGLPAALVPFLGAALQAAWSHWLSQLPTADLKPCDSLSQCPACGSPAMAGVIRHRGKYNGLRYLVCSLCACEWHVVRVKCVYCEQSKGLKYVSLDDDRVLVEKAPLRAEVCPGCNSYLKQIYLESDAEAEALSADLASLTLDMRLELEGLGRMAPNLLLAPGAE